MGVVVMPALIISYTLGYVFRDSGVPLPGGSLDLWSVLVNNKPQPLASLAFENFAVWSVVYCLAHFLMYVKPQRSLFHPFKLNSNYPPSSLVFKEVLRSVRGVSICTFYATIINHLHCSGHLPTNYVPTIFNNDGQVLIAIHILGAVVQYLWADFHFYWTHRLLHTAWFYKSVHKIHHESYNPDPFSGLSMHWFESAVYFSSAPIMALVTPLYMFRALSIGLIVFPLEGHWGFGNWNNEGSINHYIHRSKFNWNYGSSPMWDHIMGTNFTTDGNAKNTEREKQANEQAAMVRCQIGEGFQDSSQKKKTY